MGHSGKRGRRDRSEIWLPVCRYRDLIAVDVGVETWRIGVRIIRGR